MLSRITGSWTESSLSGIDPRHTSAAADAADVKEKKKTFVLLKQPTVFNGDISKEKTPHSDQYKRELRSRFRTTGMSGLALVGSPRSRRYELQPLAV